jgi:hypothetical protein
MKCSSNYSKVNITQLGAIARSCLAPGQRGKVLAAFTKAIYLLTDTNELFWIASENASMHRRCALVSTSLPRLSAGDPFHVDTLRLVLDPDLVLEIESSSVWDEPRINPKQVVTTTQLCTRVHTFFETLDFSLAKGFGYFIPHILSLSKKFFTGPLPEHTDPIHLFAQPLILDIARACLGHHPQRISQNADALIGLGAGLTPSGDDFLGGLLFAVKTIQTVYPDPHFKNYEISIDAYASQTNLISFTLLKDLANGHASLPLYHIVNGLLSGESLESIYASVSELTLVGHSTGWDLLTGLLTGLLITC